MRAAALFLALVLAGPAAATPACGEFDAALDQRLARDPSSLEVNTLLFEAAGAGCAEALPRLFVAGASRLARDREGDTALGIAARAGRTAVVETLLSEEKRQLDLADARGATPLMLAIHSGRGAIARRLLEAGAAVDAADRQGETALSEAAFAADEEIGLALLEKGARADTRDRTGNRPLCYAAARGALKLTAALIDAGGGADARCGGETTALMWAAGHPDLTRTELAVATTKLLLSRGADMDTTDDRGRSALMIAAALNRFETARVLLDAGADRKLRDKGGATAADLATTPEMRALVGP